MLRTRPAFYAFAAVVVFVASCGGGGDDSSKGGVVGFLTGTETPGPVPSDGANPDGGVLNAPKVVSITAASTTIQSGDPLRVSVSYTDAQGDLANVNFGIAGESNHSTVSLGITVSPTSGTVILDLYPRNYVPGAHVLVLSLTDLAGNTSATATLVFTIAGPDGGLSIVADGGLLGDASAADRAGDGAADKAGDAAKDSITTPPSGPSFIMGSYGDSTKNEAAGLVKVTVGGGQAVVQPLIELIPDGYGPSRIDYRKGRVAMIVSASAVPTTATGRGNIVAFDVASPATRWFVPIPKSLTTGYHYTIDATRAQLLDDGRVVVMVMYQSDDIYEDYKPRQLAIWDPAKDTIEVQGALDTFVLGQPEIVSCACDAEFGTMATSVFTVSHDGKYAYFAPMSAGTDGVVHGGPTFLARWDLVARSNERLYYTNTGATPWAVSDDGTRVIVEHDSKTQALDPTAKTLVDIEPYTGAINAGQVRGSSYIRSWRGCDAGAYGGVSVMDSKGAAAYRVLDAEKLPSPYRGVDVMSQISADGSSIYLVVSTDACTNDYTKVAIMQVPMVSENTANAVKLAELESKYDTYIFTLLDR
jgi:hypothetical protein